ncbi:tail fiber protein [Paenibacillus sp. 1011MAR3C5]|uniref:tail fiber protein n=1 Tax=Paenibacillus sp. 1011MAR3C5 TaxID=1675787 RepID=UPI002175DD42|nr:tail fiber protein [Paenibacillus sp. 1011MAR3C5]
MAYPEEINHYNEKLNKKPDGSFYTIEEVIVLADGKYEGPLAHDNIANSTIRAYSGPLLTGTAITDFVVSIPAETPWKRMLRIFSDSERVYITYQTQGDQVEADDINSVQAAITATQTEVERYKLANDALTSNLNSRLSAGEISKADKTYVDTHLLAKADKASTYTKSETDQRIQHVIGAAPEALDTLQELADALNNDPNFAATVTTQLAGKVDKESGKGLSSEDYTTAEKSKLAGIAAGANNYAHPSTHPPSIIAQDANSRFVSDAEKSTWNAKASSTVATASTAGLLSAADKTKLDGIAAGAQVNSVSSVAGKTGAVTLTKADVGLGSVENYGIASQAQAEAGAAANVYMTPERTAQAIAVKLSGTGNGDMLRSVYDSNDDGKVNAADAADTVPWAGVTGKPSTFPSAAHQHSAADISAGILAAARLPAASVSAPGIVQLSAAVNSTSTTTAATASAVKIAYDLAASKLSKGVTWSQLRGDA